MIHCFLKMLVVLILFFTFSRGFIEGTVLDYGHYGTGVLKRNYAIMANVSWTDAFDLCLQEYPPDGRLFRRFSARTIHHLMHDRFILKQNNWPNIDIWVGIMSNGYSSWLVTKDTTCIEAGTTLQDILPPVPQGIPQCLLLNMSGTSDNDVVYSAPCDQQHPYLCQPQVSIATLDTNKYDNFRINSTHLEHQPSIYRKDLNEVSCEKELAKAYNSLGFASVYNRTNGECVVYQQETVIYPVRVLMEYDINAITYVKTTGDEVVPVYHPNTTQQIQTPYSENCMNYGVTTQSSASRNIGVQSKHSTEITHTVGDTTESITHQSRSPTGSIWTTSEYMLPLTNTLTSSILAQSSTPIMSDLTQTSTTSGSISNSSSTVCECTCITPLFTPSNNSQFIFFDLHVNKKRLSSYRRRFISMTDDRFSAMVIGWSGGFILVIAVLMIILPDIVSVVKAARIMICCRRI